MTTKISNCSTWVIFTLSLYKQDCHVTHLLSIYYSVSQSMVNAYRVQSTGICLYSLFCFSLNLTHFSYTFRLAGCIIHLKIRLDNHWPKYTLRCLYGINGFTQSNVNDVTLVRTRIVCNSTTHYSLSTTQNPYPQTLVLPVNSTVGSALCPITSDYCLQTDAIPCHIHRFDISRDGVFPGNVWQPRFFRQKHNTATVHLNQISYTQHTSLHQFSIP